MPRSRLLLVICITASLLAAATISPPVGTVTPLASMLEPRSGHTATLLPNGNVLIAGGMRRNQDFYRSAELYDPAARKFKPTGQMSVGRVGHIAVLLPSGKVLIAGGWVGHGGTGSAELYDPATGRFTAISKMTVRRGRPSATLLPNGDVLIAGGEENDNESLASAEIFHVQTLSFQATGSMHHARVAHTATLLNDGRGFSSQEATPAAFPQARSSMIRRLVPLPRLAVSPQRAASTRRGCFPMAECSWLEVQTTEVGMEP